MLRQLPLLAILLFCGPVYAASLLDTGYGQMYSLQFQAAHQTFAAYEREHPSDPMGPVSDAAASLFQEFDRMKILRSEFALQDEDSFFATKRPKPDPVANKRFEAALGRAKLLAEPGLHQSPPDPNAMLADALRLGLHADYLALVQQRKLPALTEIKQGRIEADNLIATHPTYYDAYIAAGLENYLLSMKPAPVRWFLHMTGSETDRKTGLEKLRITAAKGHYLAPYARLLLAIAALRNHDPQDARKGLQWLAKEYPANPLYREELAKIQ